MEWWYCLRHMKVEGTEGCAHAERLGPYESEEAAGRSLQSAKEKSEAWDRAEADWDADLED